MQVALLTSIYDNYDTLKPVLPQQDVDVEWILVTDTVPDIETAKGWTVIHDPLPRMHPNRAAKRPKMLPWDYTDATASIWIDASYRVISSTFVKDVMEYADPIAQFVHPWRDCVYDEAIESAKLSKYVGQPCLEQVKRYKEIGFPAHQGLWATGVIARQHTDEIKLFGYQWFSEISYYSYQDQLSHPWCLWCNDLYPTSLPGTHLTNKWLQYEGSERHL